MCYFVKMSLSQVSCAVFARGLRALSMRLWRAAVEHRTTRRHPAASSAVPWRGDSPWWKARVNFHCWSQHLLPPRVALLVAGLCGKATVWCRREFLSGGRKVCLQREGASPEGVKSFQGSHTLDGLMAVQGSDPVTCWCFCRRAVREQEVLLHC